MTVESPQPVLFGEEPEIPESLEEARTRAAQAGLTRETAIDTTPRVSEAQADLGGGTRKTESLTQEPPANNIDQLPRTPINTRGGRGYRLPSESDLDDIWQEALRDPVEPGSPQARNNLANIAIRTVDIDQRYFDGLRARVASGEITQSYADALWRARQEAHSRHKR